MRRWLLAFCLALLVSTVSAADELDPAGKALKDKLLTSGKPFTAKLMQIDNARHMVTVDVVHKGNKQDPQAIANIANLQRQALDARRRNDVNAVRNLSVEIAKNQKNLYKDSHLKLDLDAGDEIKIRILQLPAQYDEKGKPRRLSEKERKAAKGSDSSLPGYTADLDSLKPEQTVEVYLAKIKNARKAKDQDGTDAALPKVRMIVIREEPKK